MNNRRVLFVDDEQNVVDGIKRQIRKTFDVSTSIDPHEALALLISEPDFAVVVSDMRMPQMSGVEFLKQVKKARPDTVRIMLTGNQDQLTAASAVNEGEVFKFLNKPCDTVALSHVLEQALRQYELITAERDLLTRTLQGSIKVLLEALSIAKPAIFGSVDRIERLCSELAVSIPELLSWEIRAAARLARIGCISLPNETLEGVFSGAQLSTSDRNSYDSHPQLGANLISEIPRLERVAQYILYQHKNFDGSGFPNEGMSGPDIPMGARLLRLVLAFDEYRTQTGSAARAMAAVRVRDGWFDPNLVELLQKHCPIQAPKEFRVSPKALHQGHTIAEDIVNKKGILLVCRGQAVTPAVKRHLLHFFEVGALADSVLVTSSE